MKALTAAVSVALLASGCSQPDAELARSEPTTTEPNIAPAGLNEPVEEPTTTTEAPDETTTTVTSSPPQRPTTTVTIPATSVARGPLPADASLTPYNGWAIPEYIVLCESGGSWDAWNPSGAAGPYQLMPFHLGGDARMFSPATQHAKAAELWAGGAGWRHWAACV